jgi:hypothetical protein
MWLDASNQPLSDKLQEAIAYHVKKYGNPPAVIEMSRYDEPVPNGLVLVTRIQRVHLPKSHFLLGVE